MLYTKIYVTIKINQALQVKKMPELNLPFNPQFTPILYMHYDRLIT